MGSTAGKGWSCAELVFVSFAFLAMSEARSLSFSQKYLEKISGDQINRDQPFNNDGVRSSKNGLIQSPSATSISTSSGKTSFDTTDRIKQENERELEMGSKDFAQNIRRRKRATHSRTAMIPAYYKHRSMGPKWWFMDVSNRRHNIKRGIMNPSENYPGYLFSAFRRGFTPVLPDGSPSYHSQSSVSYPYILNPYQDMLSGVEASEKYQHMLSGMEAAGSQNDGGASSNAEQQNDQVFPSNLEEEVEDMGGWGGAARDQREMDRRAGESHPEGAAIIDGDVEIVEARRQVGGAQAGKSVAGGRGKPAFNPTGW